VKNEGLPRSVPLPATLIIAAVVVSQGQNHRAHVIAYGMAAPGQVSAYGITALRGKFDPSSGILDVYQEGIVVLRNSNVFKTSLEAMVEEARACAQESKKVPKLKEVSIDDFLDWYMEARAAGRASVLDSIIDAVKSTNPALRFGVTIYEVELPGVVPGHYDIGVMPLAERRRIDVVHFYASSRPNLVNLPRYIDLLRREFPNAVFFIGLYNQDRGDFEHRPSASVDEEEKLFSEGVRETCSLISSGKAGGIEFYPGRFGLENIYFKDKLVEARTAIAMRDSALALLKTCAR
jgi:hypothetical protein